MRGLVQEVLDPTNKMNKERTEDQQGKLLKEHKITFTRAEGHRFPNQEITE